MKKILKSLLTGYIVKALKLLNIGLPSILWDFTDGALTNLLNDDYKDYIGRNDGYYYDSDTEVSCKFNISSKIPRDFKLVKVEIVEI